MARYLNRIAWRADILSFVAELIIVYMLAVVFMVAPVLLGSHLIDTHGTSTASWAFALAIPLCLGITVFRLWQIRRNNNWWWTWAAGIRMPLYCQQITKGGTGLIHGFEPVNKEITEWCKSLPSWTYCMNAESIVFLFRKDAMFYKLAFL